MRKTVAVLTDYLDHLAGGYETELRRGFEEACAEHDFNLLLVVGHTLGDAPYDRIYELVGPEAADALVLLTAGLAINQGVEAVATLAERFATMPLVSLGVALSGVPSIVVDNRAGLSEAIEHLIDTHGRRRILFIGGPEYNADARSRFEVYRETLARRGVAFDPALVETGTFTTESGASAMRRALDKGVVFDAVLGANDGMAIGALGVLQRAGLRVPRDVALTGFDDLVMARFTDPPLTTVRQPLEPMASLCIELVARRLRGEAVPERTEVPVEFVARRSCGCGPRTEHLRPFEVANSFDRASEWLERHEAPLRRRVADSLYLPPLRAAAVAEALVLGLRAELAGKSGAWRDSLEDAMAAAGERVELYEALEGVITLLRGELPYSSPELEALWHESRCAVSAAQARSQAELRHSLERAYWRALQSGERFSTAFDWASLKAALGEELPHAVKSAFVSLFVPGEARLEALFCLVDGKPVEPVEARYPAARLFPSSALLEQERRTLLVLPLVSETELIGIAVLEALPHTGTHEMLREQLGFAVKSVVLHQELLKRTALHERSVQERVATAKRMNALSVLAGGVAHDLNNALAPLVALPQVMMRQLDALPAGDGTQEFKEDLLRIESSALRAAQTIKDLLTLGRQGRTAREPVDLNRVVQNALLSEAVFIQHAGAKGVSIEIELHKEPLLVRATDAQIGRAISNLLRNAVEAVEGFGGVTVRTLPVSLEQPLFGYESIEPGDYACLSVSDSGTGIDAEEKDSIFEPFFSKKRLSEHSGSGLGLAIVHGVVKDHEGYVNVESSLGRGSTFTLYLPRSSAPARLKQSSVPPPRRGAARILVVDDDPTQLHTVSRVLGPLGYSVVTADTGVSAYGHFADEASTNPGRSPYDLVVVDMQLDDSDDGLAVFERIRRLYPGQRGIVVSGHAPSERVERAQDGGVGWLPKPYAADELVRAVEQALASQPPESGEGQSSSGELRVSGLPR